MDTEYLKMLDVALGAYERYALRHPTAYADELDRLVRIRDRIRAALTHAECPTLEVLSPEPQDADVIVTALRDLHRVRKHDLDVIEDLQKWSDDLDDRG